MGAALDNYNPPQPEFKALREKLAELRKGALAPKAEEGKKPELVRIPDGKILRTGMKDVRVIALRKRLNIDGDKDNIVGILLGWVYARALIRSETVNTIKSRTVNPTP